MDSDLEGPAVKGAEVEATRVFLGKQLERGLTSWHWLFPFLSYPVKTCGKFRPWLKVRERSKERIVVVNLFFR